MVKYDKLYDEIYALVAIHIAYPNSVDQLIKGEHPDWQDEDNSLGLEVVKAITPHMGYVRNLWNQYHGEDIKSIPLKNRKGFLGDFLTQKGKLISISDSKGLVDGTRHVELSIKASERKLCLLNCSHFKVFQHNELFIYVPFTINSSDLDQYCKIYSKLQSGFSNRFSKIYLFDNGCLYQIKTSEMIVDSYEYSNEQSSQMKCESFFLKDRASWGSNDCFSKNYLTITKE